MVFAGCYRRAKMVKEKKRHFTYQVYMCDNTNSKLVKYTHGLTVSQKKREVHTAHKKRKFPLTPSSHIHTHTNTQRLVTVSRHICMRWERERERNKSETGTRTTAYHYSRYLSQVSLFLCCFCWHGLLGGALAALTPAVLFTNQSWNGPVPFRVFGLFIILFWIPLFFGSVAVILLSTSLNKVRPDLGTVVRLFVCFFKKKTMYLTCVMYFKGHWQLRHHVRFLFITRWTHLRSVSS